MKILDSPIETTKQNSAFQNINSPTLSIFIRLVYLLMEAKKREAANTRLCSLIPDFQGVVKERAKSS